MKRKTYLSSILAIAMVLCMALTAAFTTPVFATVHSGTDGTINWSFDDESKTLALSGIGPTKEYTDTDKAPWDEYMLKIEHLVVNNGVTALKGDIIFCHSLKTIKLANTVKQIGEKVFRSCDDLESVDLGNGLTTIGREAFSESAIRSVKLPDTLRTIGDAAFSNCEYLSEVDLGNGVETIGDNAFLDCPALVSIKIPNSVKTIGTNAFGYLYDEIYDPKTDVTDYNWFPTSYFEMIANPSNEAAKKYAEKSGITLVTGDPSISDTKISLKAGKTKQLSVTNAGIYQWTSMKPKVAEVDGQGNVYGLSKGTTKIYATTIYGKTFECTAKVTSNPKLKVGKKNFKAKKTYKIKKGKKLTIKISGKAAIVDNAYKSSKKKVANVTSKVTAKKVKIKGYKKGSANVTITVNRKNFKVKVKVV